MALENKYIFFPVTKTGYWHNGIHKYKTNKEEFVIAQLPGKKLVKNKSTTTNIYPTKLPKTVYVKEIILTAPKVAEKYENLSSIDFSKLSKEEQEKVLEAIGLSSNPAYILQKHTIAFNNEAFSFYSLIRHFSKLYDFKKIKNYEYIFPHDKIGEYGKSEGENDMIHLEYFITNDSEYFKISAPDIFDYCDNINNEYDLYKKEEQTFEKLYFDKKTEFTVLNSGDDYKEYPKSLHLKIYRYHIIINEKYKNDNSLSVEVINNTVKVLDKDGNIVNQIKIDIKNPLTNTINTELVYTQYIKTENNDINNMFYTLDPFSLQPFWTEADSAKLQHWNNYIFTKSNVILKKYSMEPDKKIFSKLDENNQEYRFQFYKAQESSLEVLKSTENKDFIKIENNGDVFYFSKDDIQYTSNYWKDFKDATKVFLKDDLTSYNPDDDDLKNCSDLQKIMKEKKVINSVEPNIDLKQFLERNKNITLKCAFQHISEWSQVKINPFKIDYPEETSDLWEKIHIWGKDGKSSSFTKEISDSSKFIYFHPAYFENWLINLHSCFAKRLISIQDLVINDWRMIQGNCGIFYNCNDSKQTFCNHAVYETIKQVDKNYLSFLLNIDEPSWDFDRYNSNKEFVSFLKKNQSLINGDYIYKKSNLWCDILEFQSQKTEETGICIITPEQAFYMAQLGYVVIASWKNLTPFEGEEGINYSPHFVTVRPSRFEKKFKSIESIEVAHVGEADNEVRNLLGAFKSAGNKKKKKDEVVFYCNINQKFI